MGVTRLGKGVVRALLLPLLVFVPERPVHAIRK